MKADTVITVLTGKRPAYLQATLSSLQQNFNASASGVGTVIALVNGGDAPSVEVLRAFPWIDVVKTTPGPKLLPIGPATSMLHKLALASGYPLWLHLEDDWRCTSSTGWLEQARAILDKSKRIGQVRLRRSTEKVLKHHMIKRTPIVWRPGSDAGHVVADAHYTFNPSLVRTTAVAKLFPCADEPDAMRKFVGTKLLVAQALPGAFVHIGADSLRERMIAS